MAKQFFYLENEFGTITALKVYSKASDNTAINKSKLSPHRVLFSVLI